MMRIDTDLSLAGFKTLAGILLGAAFADGVFVGTEALAIHKILRDLVGSGDLPEELQDYIDAFDVETFDLEAACKKLRLTTSDDRRSLLALVAQVVEADNILDLDEDAYIRRLAALIGASKDEYDDLTVEVLSISALTTPPPIPSD